MSEREPMEGVVFGVTVTFTIAPGGLPAFLALVRRNAADSVRLEPGCRRFDVLVPAEDPAAAEVFLYELYADAEAFAHHLRTDHFLLFDAQSRGLVMKKSVAIYTVHENARP
jgi:(4S)-4-hydroxy-5-phosphonooxypentane-2,3-dione isomerase